MEKVRGTAAGAIVRLSSGSFVEAPPSPFYNLRPSPIPRVGLFVFTTASLLYRRVSALLLRLVKPTKFSFGALEHKNFCKLRQSTNTYLKGYDVLLE